jgi:sec-independent protein translocase protein TatB
MFDLSPEKLMVLLAVGLMVLGPNRLPVAARTLARGLVRVRRLTANVGDPIRASLAEPNRLLSQAVADMRDAMRTESPTPTATPAPRPTPVDPTLN